MAMFFSTGAIPMPYGTDSRFDRAIDAAPSRATDTTRPITQEKITQVNESMHRLTQYGDKSLEFTIRQREAFEDMQMRLSEFPSYRPNLDLAARERLIQPTRGSGNWTQIRYVQWDDGKRDLGSSFGKDITDRFVIYRNPSDPDNTSQTSGYVIGTDPFLDEHVDSRLPAGNNIERLLNEAMPHVLRDLCGKDGSPIEGPLWRSGVDGTSDNPIKQRIEYFPAAVPVDTETEVAVKVRTYRHPALFISLFPGSDMIAVTYSGEGRTNPVILYQRAADGSQIWTRVKAKEGTRGFYKGNFEKLQKDLRTGGAAAAAAQEELQDKDALTVTIQVPLQVISRPQSVPSSYGSSAAATAWGAPFHPHAVSKGAGAAAAAGDSPSPPHAVSKGQGSRYVTMGTRLPPRGAPAATRGITQTTRWERAPLPPPPRKEAELAQLSEGTCVRRKFDCGFPDGYRFQRDPSSFVQIKYSRVIAVDSEANITPEVLTRLLDDRLNLLDRDSLEGVVLSPCGRVVAKFQDLPKLEQYLIVVRDAAKLRAQECVQKMIDRGVEGPVAPVDADFLPEDVHQEQMREMTPEQKRIIRTTYSALYNSEVQRLLLKQTPSAFADGKKSILDFFKRGEPFASNDHVIKSCDERSFSASYVTNFYRGQRDQLIASLSTEVHKGTQFQLTEYNIRDTAIVDEILMRFRITDEILSRLDIDPDQLVRDLKMCATNAMDTVVLAPASLRY